MSTSCPRPAPLLKLKISFLLYINGIAHKLCPLHGNIGEKYPTIFIYTLHLQHFTMETKTLVIAAAVMIAATAAFALTPLVTSSAMALRNGQSQTTTTCFHNGNGANEGTTTTGTCGPGQSSQPVTTTTTKCQGRIVQGDTCPPK
jgi:hypothetical protein